MNVWDLARGGSFDDQPAGLRSVLVVMSVLVLAMKLIGAGVALAATRPAPRSRPSWLLAGALWGASSLLTLYSAGNLVIAFVTVSGLRAPSPAWEAAGGVTARSVAYVLFFLAGALLFTVLAASYQRRLHPRWTAALAGLVGAPLLLGAVLVVVPAVLQALRLPS